MLNDKYDLPIYQNEEFLFYVLVLLSIKNIGNIKAKKILEKTTNPKELFSKTIKQLVYDFEIPEQTAKSIVGFKEFHNVENELLYIKKKSIHIDFYLSNHYPKQLSNIDDSPIILFRKGNVNFNNKKIISIVGTRYNTEYGKKITESIISTLNGLDVIIVSGLALGIDTFAHQSAIYNQIPTIAILGHGLKTIFPASNKKLAQEIIQENGALMSEFFSDISPSKETFPIRNRIVAGLSDALIVVETQKKGGSMITANFANDYNKDVFAIPGKIGDIKSDGCNYLIQNNKAILLSHPSDLPLMLNFKTKTPNAIQRDLFASLNPNQQKIILLLEKQVQKIHLDTLIIETQLPFSILSAELLNLELQNYIVALPGKYYQKQTI